ncbi:enoyl-CoA hydratase-related protein [Roseateles koreensis]|uniref:Enoyl-CoA hydratase-related protein n=1 Tax=Roseateles koreensis TaxID=2987526 RepID=A0ABT5KLF6_9BURK|nr:enoyl-CoA hydratase-related protein [Roseateles koreensis]MDC8783738.1 enoyl-CoA hydratase-related protein [Roseateles koreensis]
MQDPQFLRSQDGHVLTFTLNRPQALNAFTATLLAQLRQALDEAADDASVRCVVITGAGRGFCAGQDLSDPLVKPPENAAESPRDIGHILDAYYIPLALRVRSMPVPVIAAVNGVAAGAGANFALGCDLVVAAQSANFIQAFARIGLLPDCGGTWLLPRLVGRARALQLALLGEKLPAAEAQAMGLIYQCVPDDTLAATAQALAQRLSQQPLRAMVQTRQAFDQASLLDFEDALKLEAMTQSQLGFSPDYLEGVTAFLSKRSPKFTDR